METGAPDGKYLAPNLAQKHLNFSSLLATGRLKPADLKADPAP